MCPTDHPQQHPKPQPVWTSPKPRGTVEKPSHDFVQREGILRIASGMPRHQALRFIAAADLVRLDTTALRHEFDTAQRAPMRSAACVQRTTRSNVPSPSPCESPPKPWDTVKLTLHEFVSLEGLLRIAVGALQL